MRVHFFVNLAILEIDSIGDPQPPQLPLIWQVACLMPTSPPVETNLVVGNWDGLPITFGNEVDHLFLLVKVTLGFGFVFF